MKTLQTLVLLVSLVVLLVLPVAGCGSSSTAAASGDAGGEAASMAPVPGLTANEWVWTSVAGTQCRDGSETGFAVNLASPPSDKLMIFLEGGGACVDSFFCLPIATPETFGASQFATWKTGSGGGGAVAAGTAANGGVFSRTDTANPVAGWNFVYVPYCTGDIYLGSNPNTMVPGVTMPQQFVGYTDIALDLDRIVPTFPGTTKVLLTGVSAGGFGAAINYAQTAKAFGSTPVYMLDDSGPTFEAPYLAQCMLTEFSTLWGKGPLAECSECTNPASYMIDFATYLTKTYPTVPFGLIESTQDAVISLFFGYGNPGNCMGGALPGASEPGATFTAGLQDVEVKLESATNHGAFLFTGTQHTSIGATGTLDNGITNVTASLLEPDGGTAPDAGTIKLTDWIATLVNEGKVLNVGP